MPNTPATPTPSTENMEMQMPEATDSNAVASSKKWTPVIAVGGVLLLLIIGGAIFTKLRTPQRQSVPDEFVRYEGLPAPTRADFDLGVIIKPVGDSELPTSAPIDQGVYRQAVQAAWNEALSKGSANIATFPNDPELVAFRYQPQDASAPKGLSVYKNRPVIIKTEKVAALPFGAAYRVNLSTETYQLVVDFKYTDAITELDVPTTLTTAFEQAVSGVEFGTSTQPEPGKTIVAFDALL